MAKIWTGEFWADDGFGGDAAAPESQWKATGEQPLDPATKQGLLAALAQHYAQPGVTKFTPEQVQAYLSDSQNPFPGQGLFGDSMYGGNDIWAAAPESALAQYASKMRTNGSDGFSEDFKDDFNTMLPGLMLMFGGPALGAAGTAAFGAGAAAGGAGAGAGAGGAGAAGTGAAAGAGAAGVGEGLGAGLGLTSAEIATAGAGAGAGSGGAVAGGGAVAAGGGAAGGGAAVTAPTLAQAAQVASLGGTAATLAGNPGGDTSTNTESSGFPGDPGNVNADGGSANVPVTMDPSMLQQALGMAQQFGITPESALKLLGQVAPAALGAFASNQQANSLSALADKYMALGAPSRARFESSFQPGFSMANDPGYQGALDQSAKATLHGLSVNGNPAGSPNAWGASLNDLYAKTAYPALQNYRNTNANAGGIATLQTAAPAAATGAIQSQGDIFNAIGAGASSIFNPPKSLAEQLAELRRQGLY